MKIDLGDVEIQVDEWGSGEPFVLLHGYMGSGRDFADVATRIGERRRVIALTHRGHGLSTNTGDPATYTFEQLENDVTRTVDALGLDAFDLLGHSMGGIISMRIALAQPGRVRSLVLMDTAAAPATTEQPEILKQLAELACDKGMVAFWDQVGEVWSSVAATQELKDHIRDAVLALDPFALRELGWRLFDHPSVLDDLAGLRCPVTVMVGENDSGLRSSADDLARTIPGSVLAVIEGAAHSPQAEQPEAWIETVLAHLDRADAHG
jgi:pimeloyl-ACP methyl ester carboxylesterase